MLLIEGNKMIAGPLDIICILYNVATKRYHVAFLEEKPLPGKVLSVDETPLVRLKSRMHHTEGTETLEEALEEINGLTDKIKINTQNIWNKPLDWHGEIPIVLMKENWLLG